jgi:hypothetical protein
MKGIKDLLERRNVLRQKGSIEIDEKTIAGVFRNVALDEIRSLSQEDIQEVQLKEKVLYIKTIHPAVASEIWRKKEEIRKKINEIIGSGKIGNIKIK